MRTTGGSTQRPRAPSTVTTPKEPPEIPGIVDRNIAALVARRRAETAATPRQDRWADAITGFAGSMRFVWLHAIVFGAWIAINAGWLPPLPRFDESFVMLAMVASVEAIFISTFVLVSQNRLARLQVQRADLDLQISLLAEHEISRLIGLTRAIAERLEVAEVENPQWRELAQDVDPQVVLDHLAQRQDKP
ncbi:hypothetical protein DBA29_15770 [Xenophilus aerolatus]|nr:hypothetical protein [Xenophilus aerolatus]